MVENDDLVRADHRRQAVRDNERRASPADPVEGVLDLPLGEAVEGRRRLVEDKNRRSLQDGPGDGHALLLAARQF
jgi:hypothetical protein